MIFAVTITGIENALHDLRLNKQVCPFECNLRIRRMYNWLNVTSRTEKVYSLIKNEPQKGLGEQLRR